MKRIAWLVMLAGAALAAGFAGAALNHAVSPEGLASEGTLFSESRVVLPDVRLVDQRGVERGLLKDIAAGQLLVVNFNYTACESICPTGNALMQVVDRTAPRTMGKPVTLLSVTLDPRADTPRVLRKAAAEFDPSDRWLWLTGDPQDVASVLAGAGASVPDVTLHTPLFLVGDPDRGTFYSIRKEPDARTLVDFLKRLDS